MFDPTPGYDDMLADSENTVSSPHYRPLEVPGVGIVSARKPLPNAVATLAMVANAKIGDESRAEHLTLFVRNHIDDGELERVFVAMIRGEMPTDAVERIARSIAIESTSRPTRPSSILL